MPEWWAIPDTASAEANTWVAQFSSKAYVAKIGSKHGYSRLGVGGRVFAWLTDATFSEPFTEGQHFRLQAQGTIQCQSSGQGFVPTLKISLTAGREFDGFQGQVGARSASRNLPLKESHVLEPFDFIEIVPRQQYTLDLMIFGRPSPRLEPAFLMGGWRQCFFIWQKLDICVKMNPLDRNRPVKVTVEILDCSRFPSHCLWARGRIPLNAGATTNEWQLVWRHSQQEFHSLWTSAPPPEGLGERFVRGIS
jgi:hypothetical protein